MSTTLLHLTKNWAYCDFSSQFRLGFRHIINMPKIIRNKQMSWFFQQKHQVKQIPEDVQQQKNIKFFKSANNSSCHEQDFTAFVERRSTTELWNERVKRKTKDRIESMQSLTSALSWFSVKCK